MTSNIFWFNRYKNNAFYKSIHFLAKFPRVKMCSSTMSIIAIFLAFLLVNGVNEKNAFLYGTENNCINDQHGTDNSCINDQHGTIGLFNQYYIVVIKTMTDLYGNFSGWLVTEFDKSFECPDILIDLVFAVITCYLIFSIKERYSIRSKSNERLVREVNRLQIELERKDEALYDVISRLNAINQNNVNELKALERKRIRANQVAFEQFRKVEKKLIAMDEQMTVWRNTVPPAPPMVPFLPIFPPQSPVALYNGQHATQPKQPPRQPQQATPKPKSSSKKSKKTRPSLLKQVLLTNAKKVEQQNQTRAKMAKTNPIFDLFTNPQREQA